MISVVGAGAYLLVREDIAVGTVIRQDSLQHAYEERIAALRSQLDRYASRQMIDRKLVETKVDVLLDQQEELSQRYDRLQPILDRARSTGLISPPIPLPSPKPPQDTVQAAAPAIAPLAFAAPSATSIRDTFALIDRPATADSAPFLRPATDEPMGSAAEADRAPALSPQLILEIGRSLDMAQSHQVAQLNALAEAARSQSVQIASTLRAEGIELVGATEERGIGGPYEPIPDDFDFDDSYAELDTALDELQAVKNTTERLPLAAPLAADAVSSRFGVRADPFLGRSAFHAGLDYAVSPGTAVSATAPGVVTMAGSNGGYGNMVEIDHGNGTTTRYAHLLRVAVKVGDKVGPDRTIGYVGSTGRSTGPHLHYEIRRGGKPIDPARFIRAGRKIRAFGWS